MSRNVIVGLAVLVLVALAWIAIEQMDDGTEVADAQVDAPLTTTETETEEVAVVPDVDAEPEANADVAAVETDTAPIVEEPLVGEDAEVVEIAPDGTDAETAVEGSEVELAEGAESLAEGTEQTVETAADATADAVDGAADAAGDALADAGEAAGDAAQAVGDVAADAGSDLADAADSATTDIVEIEPVETADTDLAVDAEGTEMAAAEVEATEGTETGGSTATVVMTDEPLVTDGENVETTTVAIEPVEGDGGTAEAPAEIATLLTPGTFAVEPILAYIEDSDLEDVQKASLRTTVEEAGEDPALVESAIEELRSSFDVD